MIKLTHCSIDSTVNEVFGVTIITQKFTNYSFEPIEVQIALPLCPESILHKFIIHANEQEIYSKIMRREEANQKYFDTIANNNIGIKGNYTRNNCYELSIGQVPPNQEVVLITHIVQLVELNDNSHSFSISPEILPYTKPIAYYNYNEYSNCNYYNPYGNYKITEVMPEANYSFTPGLKISNNNPYLPYAKEIIYDSFDMRINIVIQLTNGALTSITSPTNAIDINYYNSNLKASIALITQSKKPIEILFNTSVNNAIQLFEEYDPVLNVYAYTLHYYYSKAFPIENKFTIQAPGQFYFLLDQSNSMRGNRIKMAKEALLLFIQSLPMHSTLGLIGFGSKFKEYPKGMSSYNQQTTNALISSIKCLDANMAGTKLFEPLSCSIAKFNYNNNLCKHIFIVTDGIVYNPESCYNLASMNRHQFRIHSIGIGDAVDASFLRKISRYGNGSTCHVKDITTLNKDVIQILQKALKPYLNVNVAIDCDKIIEYPPSNCNRVLFEHEFFNYSFITKTKLSNLTEIKVNVYDPINNTSYYDTQTILPIITLPDGNVMNKAIMGTFLKHNKHIDQYTKANLSIQYQVLSDATSLFGEVVRKDKTDKPINTVLFYPYGPWIYNQIYIYNNNIHPRRGCFLSRSHDMKSDLISFTSGISKKSKLPINNNNNNQHCFSTISNVCLNTNVIVPNESKRNSAKTMNKALITASTSSKEYVNESPINSEYHNIIQSQNMFEGYWNDNKYTSKLKSKYEKAYKEITALLNKQNTSIAKEIKDRIVSTYIVLYYLYIVHKDKLDELGLIINKGKTFLIRNGLTEEDMLLLN